MKRVSDEKIIEMLLVHGSVDAAAMVLGIGRATIYRRMRDPTFQTLLTESKSMVLGAVVTGLTESLLGAVKALKDVISDSEAAAGTKVAAADCLLRHSLRYMESLDFERRLKALEDMQKR